jgi:predicted AAA+ superfamily ATPase
MITHEKFYFFDVGIYRNLRPAGPFDKTEEIDGAGLETIFLESLRAINDYFELGYEIYFWRTSSGTEVDFVLYGPRGIHAFEIKRSERVTTDDLKGLRLFQEDYPEARLHFLYGGKISEYHDKITVYPFVEALKKLPQLLS